MKKINVVVVEDLEEIRNGFSFLINASEDCQCIGAFPSAEDALEALPGMEVDVMILDIGLPGMSGIELVGIIKSKYPSLQIMICTVYEDDDRLFSALSAGANGYILKRSSPANLLDSILELHHGGAPMSPQIGRKLVESLHVQLVPNKVENKFNLSRREMEILTLLSAGHRNKEIAEKLFISSHTVRSHIYNIYEKLHVQTRVEAINKISAGK